MTRWEGRASGKLILLGEHAVVYGHSALAVATEQGARVVLRERPGPSGLRRGEADSRLQRALTQLLPPEGWEVEIESQLPTGRGMGSSAALSIALLRAWAAAQGQRLSDEALIRRGFELERIFHGQPSGLDHTLATLGGALVYRKGQEPLPAPLPALQLVVLDSGQAGDTRALVAQVAAQRPRLDPVLEQLGALTEVLQASGWDREVLGDCMLQAQRGLRALGVSTPRLEELVELSQQPGILGSKISGAGGGGVVIALARDPEAGQALLERAARLQIPAFPCAIPASS